MKFYAVIDTNVLVSAMLKEGSAPWKIIQEALDGCITPLLNGEILSEYGEVLLRKKFGFSESAVAKLVTELPKRALFLNAEPTTEVFPVPAYPHNTKTCVP